MNPNGEFVKVAECAAYILSFHCPGEFTFLARPPINGRVTPENTKPRRYQAITAEITYFYPIEEFGFDVIVNAWDDEANQAVEFRSITDEFDPDPEFREFLNNLAREHDPRNKKKENN